MNIQLLKDQVRAAFADVESSEFLQMQIEKEAKKHRRNFSEFHAKNPGITFEEWRQKLEASVDMHNTKDRMAIGVFLLALDELNHENL